MSSARDNHQQSLSSTVRIPLSEYLIENRLQNLQNINNPQKLRINSRKQQSLTNLQDKISTHIRRYGRAYSTAKPSQKQQEAGSCQPQHKNITKTQYEILLNKIKKFEAEITQVYQTNEQLRQQNRKIVELNSKQSQIIKTFSEETKINDIRVKDLHEQLEARKKSSEETIKQLRNELLQINIKNQKIIEIVQYLENTVQKLKSDEKLKQCTQLGLKKRVEQLLQQNSSIRSKMAKSQVQCEKYKLKTFEGEQYWSQKLQSLKNKNQQIVYDLRKELENENKYKICNLETEICRLNRILNVKQKNIFDLETRISQLLV